MTETDQVPKRRNGLSADELRDAVSYDPRTGIFRWRINRSKRARSGALCGTPNNGYVSICIDRVIYRAHRLAWLYVYGDWPKLDIDHINGLRSDNRIANLRDVSPRVNSENTRVARSKSATKKLGCFPCKGKFEACIRVRGKLTWLGHFETAEAGHQAYLKAKRELHEGCTI